MVYVPLRINGWRIIATVLIKVEHWLELYLLRRGFFWKCDRNMVIPALLFQVTPIISVLWDRYGEDGGSQIVEEEQKPEPLRPRGVSSSSFSLEKRKEMN
jgi:hypothetical protein